MTPAIGGFFCTRLYLGMKSYEEEELRMIFRHELYHYKNRYEYAKSSADVDVDPSAYFQDCKKYLEIMEQLSA